MFPDKNAKFKSFCETLEKEYPQLKKQDGAFELLRGESGGSSRPLCLLPIPAEGYNIPYLKNMVVGNGIVYIRPLKESLSLEPNTSIASAMSPRSTCTKCLTEVPLCDFRHHSSICTKNSLVLTESEDEDDSMKADIGEYFNQQLSLSTAISNSFPTLACASSSKGTQMRLELKQMFPTACDADILSVLLVSDTLNDAASLLLDGMPRSEIVVDKEASVGELLETFIGGIRFSGEEELEIDRDALWSDAIKFYKKALNSPSKLCKDLSVTFKDEDGLDGGALKVEFFNLVLKEMKNRLFQRDEPYLGRIKDCSKAKFCSEYLNQSQK